MDFIIPKIPQTILESIWEHPGKYYFCKHETKQNGKFRKTVCHGHHVFFETMSISFFRYKQ